MLQKRAVSIIGHAAAYNYITVGGAIREFVLAFGRFALLSPTLTSDCKVEYFKVFSKKGGPPISSHWSDTTSTAAVKSKQLTYQSHILPVWNELFQLHRPNTCKQGLCTDSFKLTGRHRADGFVACVYEELRQTCACQSVIDVSELWA